MGSGTIPKRLTAAFLLAFAGLCGCLPFESQTTVAWSPSGRRVGFLAQSQAWVYDLDGGTLEKLPVRRPPTGLSWSPMEGTVATLASGYVQLFSESSGSFKSERSFVLPFVGSDAESLLMWHPSGRRFLGAELLDKNAVTAEVDLDSGAVTRLGYGVGLYGPRAEWLLWAAPAPIGAREDGVLVERQGRDGRPLPLEAEAARALESGAGDLFALLSESSPYPLCVKSEDAKKARTAIGCLGRDGSLKTVARLPAVGEVFADGSRRLFAVVEEKADGEPLLRVFDAKGRLKADGRGFVAALRPAPGQDKASRPTLSRLVWSPDGNWLAWVIGGRLGLWNWRNGEVRVHEPS